MKCPVCSETQLVMADRSGIEIDYCPQCRGVWLDRGELDKIVERSQAVAPQQSEMPRQPIAPAAPIAPAPIPQQPYGFTPPRRNDDDDDDRYRSSDDRYRDNDRYRGDDYRKKKKRGGFLEDLFDFD